eukprot:CAMPEP_0179156220 /NCGR_PEP_ID=MMETSP0796-20121207/76149_1 /TAXON_ID=73915 /ORGANISM="Pyrodinium bahamense, Strain pbaha01" /LENGTH=124 /DNA_ID=CAMNT_0020857787 /DNA_START=93 /DNA_END=468 /DNA_ORIENTATION=-
MAASSEAAQGVEVLKRWASDSLLSSLREALCRSTLALSTVGAFGAAGTAKVICTQSPPRLQASLILPARSLSKVVGGTASPSRATTRQPFLIPCSSACEPAFTLSTKPPPLVVKPKLAKLDPKK